MSRGRPTRCRASGGRSPAGRWLRPDRCFQCGTPCGRCGSDDPGRPGSGSRGPAGCAAGERCCLWQCPAAATAGSGCNRCRSGCTAPEYPARVPGNGGHLRKAWDSLPFLLYRVSGVSDRAGRTPAQRVPMCSTGEHREEQVRSDIGLHHAICSYIRTKLARFWVRTAQNHGLPADFSAADRVPTAAFCTFYRVF